MRHILILGAGTAGTIMANRLARALRPGLAAGKVRMTIVDPSPTHVFQPGLIFIPFGGYGREKLLRDRGPTIDRDVRLVRSAIVAMDPETDTVTLSDGERMPYDICIVATGTRLAPEATPGLMGAAWRHSIFDFYTLEGAEALAYGLDCLTGGRLVINVAPGPIKAPSAPLEFAFLADEYLTRCGVRDRVEIVYVTPLDGPSSHATYSRSLERLLDAKDVRVVTGFSTERVNGALREIHSDDGRTERFDLLVTVPEHRGADFVATAAGLGDARNFVRTDPRTLQADVKPNVFAIGDATDCPTDKVASAAQHAARVLERNVLHYLRGEPLEPAFDGHANTLVETGRDRAMLVDFNYSTSPMPGRFPFAWGPAPLLRESVLNHIGKLAARHWYWGRLLPGRNFLGIGEQMKRAGKRSPREGTDLRLAVAPRRRGTQWRAW